MTAVSVTPLEAAARLADDPSARYLDVRSEQEFVQGHPPKALNVPILLADPTTGRMTPNPEFTPVALAVLDPASTYFVGCASGARSQQAIAVLRDFGYASLANVDGGFLGQRHPSGEVIRAGWMQCELPVETGDGGEDGWASLRRR